MRCTTARRSLFGNLSSIVQRVWQKPPPPPPPPVMPTRKDDEELQNPIVSIESDEKKMPSPVISIQSDKKQTPLPVISTRSGGRMMPLPVVSIESVDKETLPCSVSDTSAEKNIIKKFKHNYIWGQALPTIKNADKAVLQPHELYWLILIKHQMQYLERRSKSAGFPESHFLNRSVLDTKIEHAIYRLRERFLQDHSFFYRLTIVLLHTPYPRLRKLAGHTGSLMMEHELSCALVDHPPTTEHHNFMMGYRSVGALQALLWKELETKEFDKMAWSQIIYFPLGNMSASLVPYLKIYSKQAYQFSDEISSMRTLLNSVLLRKGGTSMRQAIFNVYLHRWETLRVYNENFRSNFIRYAIPNIRKSAGRGWKAPLADYFNCWCQLDFIYRFQFIPILIRRLELMSDAELVCYYNLTSRFWYIYWGREHEIRRKEKAIKALFAGRRREKEENLQIIARQREEMARQETARQEITQQDMAQQEMAQESQDGRSKNFVVRMMYGQTSGEEIENPNLIRQVSYPMRIRKHLVSKVKHEPNSGYSKPVVERIPRARRIIQDRQKTQHPKPEANERYDLMP